MPRTLKLDQIESQGSGSSNFPNPNFRLVNNFFPAKNIYDNPLADELFECVGPFCGVCA